MKHIFLFLTILSIGFMATAQSLELTGSASVDTAYFKLNDGSKDAYGYVKNISNASVTVNAIRIENNLASGHESNFCLGIFCYDTDVDQSQVPITLAPGQTDTTYKITLTHYGIPGESSVTMVLKNAADANDSILHKVYFMEDPTSGVEDDLATLGYSLDLAGSNPVSTSAQLRVALPAGATANLVLTDLAGRSLTNQQVSTSGLVELPVSGLASGIYMARLEVNGQALDAIKLVKE